MYKHQIRYKNDELTVVLDDADAHFATQHDWYGDPCGSRDTFYARRWLPRRAGQRRGWVYMHRELLGAPHGWEVQHLNGDGLDNRRENLALRRTRNTSGVPGVTWYAKTQRWRAYWPGGAHVGYFKTIDEAARAIGLTAPSNP